MDPKADAIGFQLEKISQMEIRRQNVMKSNLHVLQKLFMLIEDIKFYGTQAFASLARFGFMAKQLLVGLVTTGALTVQEEDHFVCVVFTLSVKIWQNTEPSWHQEKCLKKSSSTYNAT